MPTAPIYLKPINKNMYGNIQEVCKSICCPWESGLYLTGTPKWVETLFITQKSTNSAKILGKENMS